MAKLHCYGENSFTFLLFQSLAVEDRLQTILFPRLKSMLGRKVCPKPPSLPKNESTVFLFPNFGKSSGFGEPDALILAGDHTFWFEVETKVDLRTSRWPLNGPLLQLFRFHLLAAAIHNRSHTRTVGRHHRAFVGVTLGNAGNPRPAVLREKGHPILPKVKDSVARSFENGKDHYVLLLDALPQGITAHNTRQHVQATLTRYQESITLWCDENGFTPTREPNAKRFWYAYWEGDLKGAFAKKGLGNPLEGGRYVPIASSRRR